MKSILKKSENFLGGLFFNKKENKANLALIMLNKEDNNTFKIKVSGSCGYSLFKIFNDKLSADLKFKEIKNTFNLNKNQFLDFIEEQPIEKFL